MRNRLIVGIGEILWDVFPEGERLGGAPANVIYHLQAMGEECELISRVGEDEPGRLALYEYGKKGIDIGFIQIDPVHPTGKVDVKLDGEKAIYEFSENSAWDFLEWDNSVASIAKKADAVIFGTLAQRNEKSREAIWKFLCEASGAEHFLDVNIRKPHINPEILEASFKHADIVKMNDEELPYILKMLSLNSGKSINESAKQIINKYSVKLACVTRGSKGSVLITEDSADEHGGINADVCDTVGAGDAFMATLVYHVMRGAALAGINAAANTLGSYVASKKGAMPEIPREIIRKVINPNG